MEKQKCCGRLLPARVWSFGDQEGEKGEPETFAGLKAPRQGRRQGLLTGSALLEGWGGMKAGLCPAPRHIAGSGGDKAHAKRLL